jgi:hypothetical protein
MVKEEYGKLAHRRKSLTRGGFTLLSLINRERRCKRGEGTGVGRIPQRDKTGTAKGTDVLSEQAILQFAVSHFSSHW